MKVFETDWDVQFFCKTLWKWPKTPCISYITKEIWIWTVQKALSLCFHRLYEIASCQSSLSPIPWFHSLDMQRPISGLIWYLRHVLLICLKVLPLLFWSIASNLRYCLLSVVFFINDFRLFFCFIVRWSLDPRNIELWCLEYLKLYLFKNLDQIVKKICHKSWHLT
jgi:hypothetical protein